jgi:hypothetical protein
MATTKKTGTAEKPLIQIDDEVREMTDDEFAAYELIVSQPELEA